MDDEDDYDLPFWSVPYSPSDKSAIRSGLNLSAEHLTTSENAWMFITKRTWRQWIVIAGILTYLNAIASNSHHQNLEILQAAKYGDLEKYRRLKTQGADLNITDKRGYTLLHLAARSGKRELLSEILDDGVSMTAGGATVSGLFIPAPSPLSLAAEKKDWGMVALLLERGASPNVSMRRQRSSVGLYLLDNPGLVSTALLNQLSIDPDFKQSGSATMLGYALEIGDPELTARYLSRGANMVNVKNGSIFQACAIELPFERYQRIVDYVLSATDSDRRFLDGCLLGAVTGNHSDRVTDLLQRGAPVKNAELRGNGWNTTPLAQAIEYKRFTIAIQLIHAGARSDFDYLSHWKALEKVTAASLEDPENRQSQQVALLLLRQSTVIAPDTVTHPYAEQAIEGLRRSPNQTIRDAVNNMILLDRSSMQQIPLPE